MKKGHPPGCPCCCELKLNGPKGFSNSMADRVPPTRPPKRYGGAEGPHTKGWSDADERKEHHED